MDIDFKQANKVATSIIVSTLPGGKMEGHDYVVRSPLRSDNNPGSFRINMRDGYYHDFATDEGGDVLDLFAKINNISPADAAKKLMGVQIDVKIVSHSQPKIEESDDTIYPVPDSVPMPTCYNMELGEPCAIYEYRGKNDSLLMVVARYESNNKKQIRPYTYRKSENGTYGWKMKAFGNDSPLYGLNNVLKFGHKSIIVVEGEKCKDVLESILDEYVVVAWQGGANSIAKTDWTPLSGKQVFLWADNDEVGKKAMSEIKAILYKLSCKITDIKIPADKPAKWDSADAILIDNLTKEEILNIINPVVVKQTKPYRALGHDHGNYYFYPKGSSQVLTLHGSSLSKKTLLMVAPLDYWEMEYPGTKGIQWDLAVNNLIRECESRGIFSSSYVRGRGVWIDSNRTVVHLGGSLMVDSIESGLDDLKTRYIYETRKSINIPSSNPLSESESSKFVELCEMLQWDVPSVGRLFASWAFLAPICGILDWRPHAWITGAAGAGKSWVLNKLLNPMLGESVVYALGGSTSAGIVQQLSSDALPVVIEEAEGDNIKQKQYIEDMLTIARQSSSETGASIYRGTTTGRSVNYTLKSMFMFNSISVGLRHHADESRVTIMSLNEDTRFDRVRRFEQLSKMAYETVTKDYCSRMRARAIKMIPIIKQNVAIFSSVVSAILGSQRIGDQLGTLIAGAYAMQNDDVADRFTAENYVREMELSELNTVKDKRDEESCLSVLLQSIHKLQDRYNKPTERSLGEILSVVCENKLDSDLDFDMCSKYLLMIGIREGDDGVIFASHSESLNRILVNTPWRDTYSRMLKRIPRAQATNPIRFGPGVKDRGIIIPIDYIFRGEE
jgi:putative DNA primase/helicase